MIVSFSELKTHAICQRRWAYQQKAQWNSAGQGRELFVLKQMKSVSAWRGSLVDHVLSQEMVKGGCYDLEKLLCRARELWEKQLDFGRQHRVREVGMTQKKAGDAFAAFYDVEYGDGVSEATAMQAWQEIEQSICNLFEMESLLADLKRANYVVAQNFLTFDFGENKVRAVPDAVAFYHSEPPLIIDWKVHAFASKDYRLQLALYAMALLRAKSQRGIPNAAPQELLCSCPRSCVVRRAP